MTRLRDPQDSLLLICCLGVALLLALRGVDYASEVVALAVGGVLTKVGTTGAQSDA
jgi:hypothetical protein